MSLVTFIFVFVTTYVLARFVLRAYIPSSTAYRLRGVQFGLFVQRHREIRLAADNDARLLICYQATLRELAVNAKLREGFEESGRKYGQEVQQAAMQSYEYGLIERYFQKARQNAVTFITTLTSAEIQTISEAMSENLVEGLVPAGAFAKFYEEERELIKASPYLVERHRDRLMQRVGEMREAIFRT